MPRAWTTASSTAAQTAAPTGLSRFRGADKTGLTAVGFSGSRGWAVGYSTTSAGEPRGLVLSTADGGATWKAQKSGAPAPPQRRERRRHRQRLGRRRRRHGALHRQRRRHLDGTQHGQGDLAARRHLPRPVPRLGGGRQRHDPAHQQRRQELDGADVTHPCVPLCRGLHEREQRLGRRQRRRHPAHDQRRRHLEEPELEPGHLHGLGFSRLHGQHPRLGGGQRVLPALGRRAVHERRRQGLEDADLPHGCGAQRSGLPRTQRPGLGRRRQGHGAAHQRRRRHQLRRQEAADHQGAQLDRGRQGQAVHREVRRRRHAERPRGHVDRGQDDDRRRTCRPTGSGSRPPTGP